MTRIELGLHDWNGLWSEKMNEFRTLRKKVSLSAHDRPEMIEFIVPQLIKLGCVLLDTDAVDPDVREAWNRHDNSWMTRARGMWERRHDL